MAEGLTSETVKAAVKACNDAIDNLGNDIGELDVIEELKGYSADLAEVWQTENGDNTIIALNKQIDSLETYIKSIKQAVQDIKGDNYTFNRIEFKK